MVLEKTNTCTTLVITHNPYIQCEFSSQQKNADMDVQDSTKKIALNA